MHCKEGDCDIFTFLYFQESSQCKPPALVSVRGSMPLSWGGRVADLPQTCPVDRTLSHDIFDVTQPSLLPRASPGKKDMASLAASL